MNGSSHLASIRPLRDGVVAGVVLLVTSGLSILALYRGASRCYTEEVHSNLLRIGEAASTVIDVDVLRRINSPEQQNGPEFEQVAGPLRRILKATKSLKYVYTAALVDGEVRFVVDCAEPGDHDGDGVDDQAKIMEDYPGAPPALWEALRENRATTTPEPYNDEWGTFITAFVPIRDHAGQQIGVVGVDITAEEYVRRMSSLRGAAITAGAAAFALAAALGGVVISIRRQYLRASMREDAARESATAALEQERDYIQSVLQSMADMLVVIAPDGLISAVNGATCRSLGYAEQELVGRSVTELFDAQSMAQSGAGGDGLTAIPQPALPLERALLERLMTQGSVSNVETTLRTRAGGRIPVVMSGAIMRDDKAEMRGIVCLALDVSKRKQAEQALRESEVRLRAITDSAQDAIIMLDHNGAISFWNPAAEAILGYPADEVIGRNLHNLIAPERFRAAHHAAFPEFQKTGRGAAVGRTLELAARRRDGYEITVSLSLSAVNLHGQWHAVGVLRDITQRRNVEEALEREHAAKAQLLAAIPSILVGVNHCGFVVEWNRAAAAAFGVAASDAVGVSLEQCLEPREWAALLEGVATCCTTGQSQRFKELRFTHPDGREGFLDLTISPIADERDQLAGCLIVGEDITERRELELQLRQSQRLESVGQLAAGIAHEINTPTQFVSDNVRFLRSVFPKVRDVLDAARQVAEAAGADVAPGDPVARLQATVKAAKLDYLLEQIPEALSDSLEGLERTTKIVRAMKDFAHPGQQSMAPADLNKAIESTVTVARNEWKYVADMKLELDPSLPPVTCLLGDLNQVVLNLVVNAAHAIKDVVGDGGKGKGTITVSSAVVGDQVEIRVRDTGTGIAPEHREKIFNHFFTTKGVGKGTGQGLAIARRVIVEKHGGTLTFETETGRGTTFIIRLPIERPERAPAEKPDDALAHSAGR